MCGVIVACELHIQDLDASGAYVGDGSFTDMIAN